MDTTKVYSKLLESYVNPDIRIIALKGSTRSGKTWATLQLLNTILHRTKKPRLISVVSETMPHLKRGCIRDFQNMLQTDGVYNPESWNMTDKIYRTGLGSMEFFSADSPSKVLGPARNILFINECINIPFEVYRQLAVRTTEKIILDYNPAFEFWIDSKIAPRKDAVILHSTYKDNDMLTAAQIDEIESNKEIDPEWWKVYGLGQTGSKQGLIVQNWDIVSGLPPQNTWKKSFIGLDWGWTAPSAIMLVVLGEGGEVWIDELGYGPHMDNPDIAKLIIDSGLRHLEVIADPAEPKSKQELRNAGLNVPDNVTKDVDLQIRVMNRYKKHYTQRSVNSIDENRKYRYGQDINGDYTGVPVKKFDHAKNAEQYVFLNRLSNISTGVELSFLTL